MTKQSQQSINIARARLRERQKKAGLIERNIIIDEETDNILESLRKRFSNKVGEGRSITIKTALNLLEHSMNLLDNTK